MAFTKSETNPNAAVGGGCIGTGGQRGFDCAGPFYTAEGVVGLNATSPKIVICTHCLGELNRAAAGEAIVPAGYNQVEPTPVGIQDTNPNGTKAAPKPRRPRKESKPPTELSL